jgi:hypothetical protein
MRTDPNDHLYVHGDTVRQAKAGVFEIGDGTVRLLYEDGEPLYAITEMEGPIWRLERVIGPGVGGDEHG